MDGFEEEDVGGSTSGSDFDDDEDPDKIEVPGKIILILGFCLFFSIIL